MTDEAIDNWLTRYAGVHSKEIAMRVGEARQLLTEMKRLRAALAFQTKRNDDVVCGWGAVGVRK